MHPINPIEDGVSSQPSQAMEGNATLVSVSRLLFERNFCDRAQSTLDDKQPIKTTV
jgi:hypothetical protein